MDTTDNTHTRNRLADMVVLTVLIAGGAALLAVALGLVGAAAVGVSG